MLERRIRDGDILIATTARPAHGKIVVDVLQGSFRLTALERRNDSQSPRPAGTKEALPVSEDAEIWAIVAGLAREAI